jgi:hypothetical protein
MQKNVMIFVKDAKYYPLQQSILIVGVEVESKKPITQQILTKSLAVAIGLPPELVDDHEAWKFFAIQLKGRREPFRLVFDGSKTDEDEI